MGTWVPSMDKPNKLTAHEYRKYICQRMDDNTVPVSTKLSGNKYLCTDSNRYFKFYAGFDSYPSKFPSVTRHHVDAVTKLRYRNANG